jgi:hypothetical protein
VSASRHSISSTKKPQEPPDRAYKSRGEEAAAADTDAEGAVEAAAEASEAVHTVLQAAEAAASEAAELEAAEVAVLAGEAAVGAAAAA